MNALLEARGPDVPAAAQALELDWFQAFHKEHANFVRSLMRRLAGGNADGDDLVQEVFLVAFRKWPELREAPPVDPRSWLYGVAVRVAQREWRRRKLRNLLRREATPEKSAKDDRTPEALVRQQEARAVVLRLLASLSANKRTVFVLFVLFELEGLPGRQIADILGVPIQTVWNRLFHARKAFLKLLARERLRERRETDEE